MKYLETTDQNIEELYGMILYTRTYIRGEYSIYSVYHDRDKLSDWWMIYAVSNYSNEQLFYTKSFDFFFEWDYFFIYLLLDFLIKVYQCP